MLDMSGSHRTPPAVIVNGDGNEQQDQQQEQQQQQQEQGLNKDSAKNSNGDIKGKNSPNGGGKNTTPNGKNTPSGGKKTPSEKNSQNQPEDNVANQIVEQEQQNVIRIENHNVRSPSKLSEQVNTGDFTLQKL